MQKLETDDGFGSRFYRALAAFLADRFETQDAPRAITPWMKWSSRTTNSTTAFLIA
jgi:hypothetical protein